MMLIEINNNFIIVYLSQTFVSFLIVDQYEQRTFHRVIKDYKDKPISKIYHPMPLLDVNKNLLKESYFPNREKYQLKEKLEEDLEKEPMILWLDDGNDSCESEEGEMRENYGVILRNSLRREGLNESFIVREYRSCSF